jgi:glyoxylase-like metal-dependent hydrolase (beta-lactamase superfamily II)
VFRGKEQTMKSTGYGEGLVQLTRYPNVFPVNACLVREDDGFTLVDTGLSGGEEAYLVAARERGGEIRRIALTHAHGDHTGSLDALHDALPEAEVLVPAREASFLRGDLELTPEEQQVGGLKGWWKAAKTEPTRVLSPGDRVGSLEVVAAPGHTPGQVAYFDARDRTLIAGDAFQTRAGIAVSGVIRPLFPFPALATWSLSTALESARRLRALSPSRLAVGHGPVLEDPLEAMDHAIEAAERKTESRQRAA